MQVLRVKKDLVFKRLFLVLLQHTLPKIERRNRSKEPFAEMLRYHVILRQKGRCIHNYNK